MTIAGKVPRDGDHICVSGVGTPAHDRPAAAEAGISRRFLECVALREPKVHLPEILVRHVRGRELPPDIAQICRPGKDISRMRGLSRSLRAVHPGEKREAFVTPVTKHGREGVHQIPLFRQLSLIVQE